MSNFAARIAALGATGHWRLNENGSALAVDAIGSNNLLWDVNYTIPTRVAGLINGETDYAQALAGTSQSASGSVYAVTDNFTLMALVANVGQSQNGYILFNGTPSAGVGLLVSDGDSGSPGNGNKLTVHVPGASYAIMDEKELFQDATYLITLVRRAGTWELYINDWQWDTLAGTPPTTPVTRFIIGSSQPGSANDFVGTIGEVAYFPVAITQANIIELNKLVFMQPPSAPTFAVADSGTGYDAFTLTTASVAQSFPLDGYAIWEGTSSDEATFDFTKSPLESIAVGGTFTNRRAVAGKYYAIKAFDDRTIPNYGPPQVLASVGVPVDVAATQATAAAASAATAASSAATAAANTTVDADGYDIEESLKLLLAVNVGKVTATATSAVFRDAADTKARVTAATTADGSRTAITLDVN